MADLTKTKNKGIRRKTLLFVGNTAWSMYNFRLEVLKFFSKDYNVIVLAPDDAWGAKLLNEGITYIPIVIDNKGTSPLNDLKLFWNLVRLYRKYRPSLVFHYTIKPNIYGSTAAALLRIKSIAVVTGVGTVFYKDNILTKWIRRMFRFSFRYPQEVWFLNRDDQELFTSSGLVSPAKSILLPSEGIDTATFKNTSGASNSAGGTFSFLFLGRILWDKGIGEYVEAARNIKKQYSNICFRILGFLDQRNPSAIRPQTVTDWHREGVIEYLGSSDNVKDVILTSDCVVLPSSYREGIPRSLLEAASLEKPVIASDIPGCRDVVVNEVTGYLCKPMNASDLQKKMEKMFLAPPEERMKMGKAGREKVESQFAIEVILSQYQKSIVG